jgi:hypothetical protein
MCRIAEEGIMGKWRKGEVNVRLSEKYMQPEKFL